MTRIATIGLSQERGGFALGKVLVTTIVTRENIDGVEHTEQDLQAYVSDVADYMNDAMTEDMTVDVTVKIEEEN